MEEHVGTNQLVIKLPKVPITLLIDSEKTAAILERNLCVLETPERMSLNVVSVHSKCPRAKILTVRTTCVNRRDDME